MRTNADAGKNEGGVFLFVDYKASLRQLQLPNRHYEFVTPRKWTGPEWSAAFVPAVPIGRIVPARRSGTGPLCRDALMKLSKVYR
jgi:hypothetical protein